MSGLKSIKLNAEKITKNTYLALEKSQWTSLIDTEHQKSLNLLAPLQFCSKTGAGGWEKIKVGVDFEVFEVAEIYLEISFWIRATKGPPKEIEFK